MQKERKNLKNNQSNMIVQTPTESYISQQAVTMDQNQDMSETPFAFLIYKKQLFYLSK